MREGKAIISEHKNADKITPLTSGFLKKQIVFQFVQEMFRI
jgi:hypothetical protein